MFDAIFRFFFSLSPVVFSQGEYRFAPTTGSYVAAVLVLAGAALAIVAYRSGRGRKRDRVVLAGIRLAILTIILICLFRPLLVVRAASPQQNFLAVLLDDSRSMQIADVGGQPRGTYITSEFGAADPRLAGSPAQPGQHRDRRDGEAQPGQQENRKGRGQGLAQSDVDADERHARE